MRTVLFEPFLHIKVSYMTCSFKIKVKYVDFFFNWGKRDSGEGKDVKKWKRDQKEALG